MDKRVTRIQESKSMEDVETIILEAYPRIHSYVIRRVQNASLAKDITQDTFYSFYSHLHQYENKGKLLNYLYRIAGNKIIDYHRSQAYIMDDYEMESIQDLRDEPHISAMKGSQVEVLKSHMKKLSAKDQDVLILRFYQDLKYRDIAAITGMNVSTVKSRVKRALETMETLWKEGVKNVESSPKGDI